MSLAGCVLTNSKAEKINMVRYDTAKKEIEGRRNKDEGLKKELVKARAWIDEFDPKRLEFEDHRLEVRFPSLKIELSQKIKRSPFVEQKRIGKERVCIRVVLLTA